jgi:bifunctional UDP-N-acetylglucosamine pyrophosphorylase / glucosamine-1-phosphate N-acetyltransferase
VAKRRPGTAADQAAQRALGNEPTDDAETSNGEGR